LPQQHRKQLLSAALGDTAQWRFSGYDAQERTYLPYDTIRSGMGGWLFHTGAKALEWQASGIAPDTLFPVVLRAGWNCVGNPFPFSCAMGATHLSISTALCSG
jgi:hypothetical protein